MKVVVVVPTYNEKENIGKLIDVLSEEIKLIAEHEVNLLVVDGNSPDGTAEVVNQKSQQYPFVHLLLEKKKAGLGAAYFYAFEHAIKEMNADVLVEMDADFQHDPKVIKEMIKEIDNGADYVIGSRFTTGGSIPKEWSLYRKFLSIGGNIFSKIVLGIWNVNDFTSGFKASRVKGFVDKIDFTQVLSKGFAYKTDLLFKMHRLGAKIKEVPIVFGLRDRGDSKMERNNAVDSLKVVIMLRLNENKNLTKFLIVGLVGLAVDSILFNILRLIIEPAYGALISGALAMLTTFLFNNYWSFRERKLEGATNKARGVILYFVSSSVPILVRTKFVYWATLWFGNTFIVSNVAFVIGIIFGLIWNFTVYSKIIWRK